MKRLTGRNEKGDLLVNGKMVYAGEFYEVASALEEYEKLEEDGKLLELPCKPGDTVYLLIRNGINDPFIMKKRAESLIYCVEIIPKIGKNIFLTEKEAEKNWRKENMLEIDCRKCKNCTGNECLIYGKNEKNAIEMCASDSFVNYKKEDCYITLNMYFRVEGAEMFCGETGYCEIKIDVKAENLKEINVEAELKEKISRVANMMKVQEKNVTVVSRKEYEENVEDKE